MVTGQNHCQLLNMQNFLWPVMHTSKRGDIAGAPVFKVARRGLDIPVFGILLQLH